MEYEPFYRVIPKINTNLLLASGVGNTAHYSAMLLTYMQAINAAKLQHGVLSRTVLYLVLQSVIKELEYSLNLIVHY